MSNGRILDFALTPVKLRIREKQLQVYDEDAIRDSIPVEDVGCVLLAHSHMTFSLAVIRELMEANVPIVFCDERSVPAGMCLPFYGHHAGAERAQGIGFRGAKRNGNCFPE